MNKHHRTLELDRVLEMLAEQTTCPAGRELARQLTPNDNYRDAADALQRTADINSLCARYGTPGLGGIRDCTGALQRAKLGARLSAGEILPFFNAGGAERRKIGPFFRFSARFG